MFHFYDIEQKWLHNMFIAPFQIHSGNPIISSKDILLLSTMRCNLFNFILCVFPIGLSSRPIALWELDGEHSAFWS